MADDVAMSVADVPGRVPQIFRLARVVVDLQGRESGMSQAGVDDGDADQQD